MRKALVLGIALLVTSVVVLGGTVFRQQVADAANLVNVFVTNDTSHPVPAREQNLDANGNIKVHEQGTASVNITNATVPVHEQGTASVNVTNSSLSVAPSPISDGGDAVTLQAGDSASYSPPATASALTMVLTAEVDSVFFSYQNSTVAIIIGPSETSQSLPASAIYLPLTRPIKFDQISCFANGNPGQCKIGWVGNVP
jgi:hypothetical protein